MRHVMQVYVVHHTMERRGITHEEYSRIQSELEHVVQAALRVSIYRDTLPHMVISNRTLKHVVQAAHICPSARIFLPPDLLQPPCYK